MKPLRDLAALTVKRPVWSAVCLGAIAACGFQPLALWPLTLLAIAALIQLIAQANSWRAAAFIGWAFGLGHFTLGNNWIATAFTYQANMPAWLGWIAVFLLSIYLALFPALAALGAWLFSTRLGRCAPSPAPLAGLGLAFAGMWIIAEWMRAWLFTGFAWNPLGIVLLAGFKAQGVALLAPWTGTYGLSGLVVLIAAWLRIVARRLVAGAAPGRIATLAWNLPLAAVLTAAMVARAHDLGPARGGIAFTLVQPDVRQEVLNDPLLYETHFRKTARLSSERRPAERRVVFWPESGLPDYLREGYPAHLYRQTTYAADPVLARERLGQVIGPRSLLMTGAVDLVMENGDAVAARNVITAIDGRGDILASYAKAHLVPYGEYLALRWLLEPLGATRLVAGALDFHPGPGPRTYDFGPWGKAGMQICYEIIFSGQVVEPGNRPDYIFNPSNDGWFGSWGPPQHLAQARLRAIEEGLPVLRATTTGISAVIDAEGIVRQHIARHRPARLDGVIPYAREATAFARFGNALPLAWAVAILLASLVALHRRNV